MDKVHNLKKDVFEEKRDSSIIGVLLELRLKEYLREGGAG